MKISSPFFGTHCIGQIAIVVLFLARRRMRISVMLDVLGMGLQSVAEIRDIIMTIIIKAITTSTLSGGQDC